nr:hypothetical protein [uncultured Acetatifactor sp.]
MCRELLMRKGEDNEMDEEYEFQVGNRDMYDTIFVIEVQGNNTDGADE